MNAEGNEGFRPIFFAVYPRQDATVLRLLLAAGANPNVHLSNGATPLHMAAQLPTADHLAALLDAGADPNAPGEYNCPVVEMVGKDRGDMVRLLARHGADLNVVYSTRTPLISAVMSEEWVKAATLLGAGADPTCKDMHGRDAAAVFCERLQGLPTSYEPNRVGVPLLAKAFADRGVQLPCAGEVDKFR